MALGGYSGEAKIVQTNAIARGTAPSFKAEFVTVGTQAAVALNANTTTGSRIFHMASGAPATKAIVVFAKINNETANGKEVNGIVIGRPYWVRNVSTTEFEIAYTKAGAESATAGEHEEATGTIESANTEVVEVKEHTGAKTARAKTAPAEATNATKGVAKDAAREVEISANATKVRWVMYFSALTNGEFAGCSQVTEKELAEGDIYKVTEGQLSENAAA